MLISVWIKEEAEGNIRAAAAINVLRISPAKMSSEQELRVFPAP
jgi:hypothetical protein